MRLLPPLLLVPLVLAVAPRLDGQTDRLNPDVVAPHGATPRAMLPARWKIEQRLEGDLNGDAYPDLAVEVVAAPASKGVTPEPALVILLGEEHGYRVAGVGSGVLAPGYPQYSLELYIRNRVLVAEQMYGMSQVTILTHRFRLDPASGRFLLIGRDQHNYTRPLNRDDTLTVSENYLTGVRLITTGHVRNGVVARESVERQQIPRSRTFIEDVDEFPDY